MEPLPRSFYLEDTISVAKNLLGKLFIHETPEGVLAGKIVETEAYLGAVDAASHCYQNRRTKRTEVIFGEGGFAYVYFIYGMYYCMNVVAGPKDTAHAILIRALEPLIGLDTMRKIRKVKSDVQLANGPGKLCAALAIDKNCNGLDLCNSALTITPSKKIPSSSIVTTTRVNIDYAKEAVHYPYRFYIKDNPFVSVK